MIRLNNKGQSLAIFVIFIPVLIMLGALVVDLSLAKYNKIRLDNIAKQMLRYGLNNIDNAPYDNMVDLIYQNDDEIDDYKIDIDNSNKNIFITISKSTKGFFGSVINKEIYKEKSSYVGYFKDDKMMIEKKVN